MDLKSFAFRSPNTVLFGFDSVKEVGRQALGLGAKKVLLVTDKGVIDAGMLGRVRDPLESEGLQVSVFDRALPEPPLTSVLEALAVARSDDFQVLVGFGGGSVIDLTKAISALLENDGDLPSYFGIDKVPRPGRPLILIPTTAGTGSEVTRMSVLTDVEANLKKVIVSPNIMGRVAIVDPILTVSASPRLTASSGIDALIHSIEGYIAVASNPFSDTLALESIRLMAANLVTAVKDGRNEQARYAMSLGSLMAGAIINSAGTGAVHALAYPIGGEYHAPHGVANYLTLPQVMALLAPSVPEKFVNLASALGESIQGLTSEEAASRAIQVMRRLGEETGLPTRLRDVGVVRERIPAMAEAAYTERRLLGNTPRDFSVADIASIYEEAF